jgi:hypothetical protein
VVTAISRFGRDRISPVPVLAYDFILAVRRSPSHRMTGQAAPSLFAFGICLSDKFILTGRIKLGILTECSQQKT